MRMTLAQTIRHTPSAIKHLFTTDGCSMSPDFDFYYCCKDHDYAYFTGHPKLPADWRLTKCIWKRGRWFHKLLAPVYGSFVVAFGLIPYWNHARRRKKYGAELQEMEVRVCDRMSVKFLQSKQLLYEEFRNKGGWTHIRYEWLVKQPRY